MNKTQIVLLGLLAVLVAVWVSSATLRFASAPAPPPLVAAKATRPSQSARPTRSAPPRDVTTFDLNQAAERLRARVIGAPPAHATSRNPFEFGPLPTPHIAAAPAVAPATAVAPPPPPGPLPPPFALTGIAEQKNGDALERTAILTGNNQIYFAKRGDRVIGRYEVTAVGSDAIELREIDGGNVVRLGLR